MLSQSDNAHKIPEMLEVAFSVYVMAGYNIFLDYFAPVMYIRNGPITDDRGMFFGMGNMVTNTMR